MPRRDHNRPHMYGELERETPHEPAPANSSPAPEPTLDERLAQAEAQAAQHQESVAKDAAERDAATPKPLAPTAADDAKSAGLSAGNLAWNAFEKVPVLGGFGRLAKNVGGLVYDTASGRGGEGLKKFAAKLPGDAASLVGGGLAGDATDFATQKIGEKAGVSKNVLPQSDIGNLADIAQRQMGPSVDEPAPTVPTPEATTEATPETTPQQQPMKTAQAEQATPAEPDIEPEMMPHRPSGPSFGNDQLTQHL